MDAGGGLVLLGGGAGEFKMVLLTPDGLITLQPTQAKTIVYRISNLRMIKVSPLRSFKNLVSYDTVCVDLGKDSEGS